MSRRLVRILVIGGLVAGLTASPASADGPGDDEVDPFPLGVCLKATKVHPRPICILIDPDRPPSPDQTDLDPTNLELS